MSSPSQVAMVVAQPNKGGNNGKTDSGFNVYTPDASSDPKMQIIGTGREIVAAVQDLIFLPVCILTGVLSVCNFLRT